MSGLYWNYKDGIDDFELGESGARPGLFDGMIRPYAAVNFTIDSW